MRTIGIQSWSRFPKSRPKPSGALIALYERAVGLYASLVNVNAYHQPGVEAGKKAAAGILDLQKQVMQVLKQETGSDRDRPTRRKSRRTGRDRNDLQDPAPLGGQRSGCHPPRRSWSACQL